jgi:hypothetical protein
MEEIIFIHMSVITKKFFEIKIEKFVEATNSGEKFAELIVVAIFPEMVRKGSVSRELKNRYEFLYVV